MSGKLRLLLSLLACALWSTALAATHDADYVCFDSDRDGFGDPGHPENDCPLDNCPDVYNPDQADANGDGIGDACCCLWRGDINNDGNQDISDLTYLVAYLFTGGPIPPCPEQANIDNDSAGSIDVSDLTLFVSYIFGVGFPLVPCD